MKLRTTATVLGGCACLLAAATVILAWKYQTASVRAKKLDQFCRMTKMTMQDDRNELLSGDSEMQAEAASRFWRNDIYQGAASVAYCMDETKIPQMPLNCPLLEDQKARWKCLGDFASKVEQALR